MIKRRARLDTGAIFIASMLALSLTACEQDRSAERQPAESEARSDAMSEAESVSAVEIVTRDYAIEGPDTLPMGWHTFRFRNEGGQAHFVITYRLAEGKTIEDQKRGAVAPFDEVLRQLQAGELAREDIGATLGELLEPWVFENVYTSGPGLVSPGGETQTTVHFDKPGTYLMECYVKSPDGRWHTSMGMLRQFQVTAEQGGGEEPEADAEIVMANSGMQAPESLSAGRHTIRVVIQDDPETFMPYDVHVARLSDDQGGDADGLAALIPWMDWTNVGGLRAPAPPSVTFLGGVENMPAGNHGYVTVDLEPGRYVWISEVDAGQMHQVFHVE